MEKAKRNAKWIAVAVAVIIIVVVASFYYFQPIAPKPKVTVTLLYTAEPTVLDPGNRWSTADEVVDRQIYDSLFEFTEHMDVLPNLATSWTTTDAKTWEINLRQDVKFHDGTPFNSSCVVFNFNPANISAWDDWTSRAGYFQFLARVEEDGLYKVKIICKNPFAPLLAYMAHVAGSVVSPSAKIKLGRELSNNPVGTGPFKFAERISGEKIVVKKNEEFWRGVPKIDEIIIMPVTEGSTRTSMLETGQADLVHDVPFADIPRLKANPNITVIDVYSVRCIAIGLNCARFPFNITKVRQAMNYAIDVQKILDTVVGGMGRRMDCPASPDTFGYTPCKLFEYNVTKAKELLAEAGYPNGFPDMEFKLLGTTLLVNSKEIHLAVADYLSKIGINAKVEMVDHATLVRVTGEKDPTKQYDMFSQTWAPSNGDSDWVLRPIYSSYATNVTTVYFKFYANQRVDELIAQGMAEADREKRRPIYAEAHQLVYGEAPCLWLYNMKVAAGIRKNLHNVTALPVDVYVFKNVAYKD
jgi:ABC-type transport system substrate-binding protein